MTYKELIKQLLRDFEALKKENIALRLRIVELEKKMESHSSEIYSAKCARRRVDIMKKAFVEELLAIVMCMLFNIRLILQRYK